MRSMFVAWFLAGAACGTSSSSGPSLTITPSDLTAPITQPTVFTAVLVNSTDDVSWSATGGALSNTAGLHVTYTPPLGTAMGTLTATAGKLSVTVQISSESPSKTIPGLTAAVTVRYDAQEVPHIQCAAAADCVRVQGYLQARDRLFPMDFTRHVARSRLSEMIGVLGLSQDVQLRTLFITRDGKRLEGELSKVLDTPTKALLDAFAAGVNAYLAELRAGKAPLPGEYAQLPFRLTPADIADWTVQDTLAIGRLNQFQLSETLNAETANGRFAQFYQGLADGPGKINAWIRAAAPTGEQAHTLSLTATHAPTPVPAAGRLPTFNLAPWRNVLRKASLQMSTLHDALRPLDASVGSNNWVVAGAKSASHVAMVANDPHLPLQYPPLFHLVAMTSSNPADNLDITGGSFPGVPGALVGRGAHVGWGVTVVGYDVTDVYLEQAVPCPNGVPSPLCVKFNDNPVATLPVPETYCARVPAGVGTPSQSCPSGTVDSKSLPPEILPSPPPAAVLVVPHHGPIIQAPDAQGKAVSVRWTGQEGNTQDSKAFYGLATATNVDTAMTALKDYATGAQNFVLADDQGHIAYDPHALVPVRRFADARVVGTSVMPPWFPLPGDGTAEWGDGTSDCVAAGPTPVPASCWLSDADLPHGKDPAKGYFFTANADPTSPSVSDDNNPLAHPPYVSFDWDDSSGFRATRIQQRIEAAITAHGNVTLDDMQSIQSDHVSGPGMAFAPLIAALPTGGGPPDLAAAKAVIAQWQTNGFDCPSALVGSDPTSPAASDATVLQSSAGCLLFHAFLRTLVNRVFSDDLAFAGQGVNQLAAVKALLFLLGLPDGAPGTSFCNDVNGQGAVIASHTCGEQAATALLVAYDTLTVRFGASPNGWIWGRVHTMQPVSLLSLVTTDYRPGPFARPGGAFTVDVGSPSLAGTGLDFPYGSSGNVRHISVMDPAAPKVKMQLPGPERDGPATTVGPNLLGQWVSNTYFDYAAGAQINNTTVSMQTFKAP